MITFNELYVDSAIDLNKVTGIGTVYCSASINACKSIPVQLSADANVFRVTNTGVSNTGATAIQKLEVLSINPRTFIRSVTHNWGGFPYGGNVSFGAWSEIRTSASLIDNNITFDQTATRNIGRSDNTVKDLFMQNAVTVVSDENKKSEIQDIPDAVLNAWANVNFQMYKLNDSVAEKGTKARFHFGVIAQRIKEAFDNAGLDYNEYGLLTYDKWEAIQGVDYKPATYDDKGNQLTAAVQAVEPKKTGEVYMVRYDECMILEMAYQRKRIAELEAKLK